MAKINANIQSYTDQFVEEFKQSMEENLSLIHIYQAIKSVVDKYTLADLIEWHQEMGNDYVI